MLSQDEWKTLERLFAEAVDLPSDAQIAFAKAHAGHSEHLYKELMAMLAISSTQAASKALRKLGELFVPMTPELEPNAQLGPWQIDHLIGKGGMGHVYLAHRADGSYQRDVAIKVMSPNAVSETHRAYFQHERQALAQMQHPAIAQIFDGGSDELGRMYLVMEYIQGRPITQWCEEHALSLRERIQLLIQVCDGVMHAHQKGVIHRDLKPANILVLDNQDSPTPKIIDFGISSNFSNEITEKPEAAGTPGYMSPEQASGDADIDIRSDVYSLGALLYELIANQRPPRAADDTSTQGLKPSHTFNTLSAQSLSALARTRRTRPGLMRRTVREDLDWIVHEATQTDRELRYSSVSLLKNDLNRWLNGYLPSAAPQRPYLLAKKFIARNRWRVGAAFAISLAIIGGLVTSTLAWQRAESTAKREQVVSAFLSNILTSVNPGESYNLDKKLMLHVLNNAAERVKTELPDQPQARAEIQLTIAEAYQTLGMYEAADEHLNDVHDLVKRDIGTPNLLAMRFATSLSQLRLNQGQLEESVALLKKAIPPPDNYSHEIQMAEAILRRELAEAYRLQGNNDLALTTIEQVRQDVDQLVPPSNEIAIETSVVHAIILTALKRYEDALAVTRQALKDFGDSKGLDHPRTLKLQSNFATLLMTVGEAEHAIEQYRDLIRRAENHENYSAQQMLTGLKYNLARALVSANPAHDPEEIGSLYLSAVNDARETMGNTNPNTFVIERRYALWLHEQKRLEESQALFLDLMSRAHTSIGPQHPLAMSNALHLADVELALGNIESARSLALETLKHLEESGQNLPATYDHAQTILTTISN